MDESKLIEKYIKVTKINEIKICGIEFVRDENGICWTYDLNCNTNYNSDAESRANIKHKALNNLIDIMKLG